MTYRVRIKLADDTVKEFNVGSDVDLPTGLSLTAQQIAVLMSKIDGLVSLMGNESWKEVRIDIP